METVMQCQTLLLVHILGKKWSIPIVETIFSEKKVQFNTLQTLLLGITPKNLSSGLKDLIIAEIVKKSEKNYNNTLHTEYSLTKQGLLALKFIRSAKQLGVSIYYMDPSCPGKKCADCLKF